MTRDQIIDVANKRTEQRGAKKLDLQWEFYTVLQDLCGRRRWFWRKKRYTFTTVAGTSTYDLSSSTVIASAGGVDVEEIIKDSVLYVRGTNDFKHLGVVFDEDLQAQYIRSALTGEPEGIFIEPGSYQTVRVVKIPTGAFTIDFMAWAMPNGDFDGLLPSIPLVPKYMHPILVKGLEAQILRFTAGEGSAKYLAASGEYEAQIQRFAGREGISGKTRQFIDESGEAVQST